MSMPRSVKISYAVFSDHIHTPELLRARTAQLFDWIRGGQVKIAPAAEFTLSEAAAAHRAMERRATTGKLLLIP